MRTYPKRSLLSYSALRNYRMITPRRLLCLRPAPKSKAGQPTQRSQCGRVASCSPYLRAVLALALLLASTSVSEQRTSALRPTMEIPQEHLWLRVRCFWVRSYLEAASWPRRRSTSLAKSQSTCWWRMQM